VIIATPVDMASAEDLIAKLDIPTPEGRGQIHVYYLAHANAEELAKVLTAQAGELSRPPGSRETTGTTPRSTIRRPTTPTTPTTPAAATTPTTAQQPQGYHHR
jgi:type II secretory pathway component GspD/PulD (secretin)